MPSVTRVMADRRDSPREAFGSVRSDGFATLICEAAAPFVEHSTNVAGVPLEPNGDFRIDDTLNPGVPTDCASPVLLIRNTGGLWFAAGILKTTTTDLLLNASMADG